MLISTGSERGGECVHPACTTPEGDSGGPDQRTSEGNDIPLLGQLSSWPQVSQTDFVCFCFSNVTSCCKDLLANFKLLSPQLHVKWALLLVIGQDY